ncbi:MAG: hypothetical protein ACREUT_04950 [Steroidobacteraceae bacterium]
MAPVACSSSKSRRIDVQRDGSSACEAPARSSKPRPAKTRKDWSAYFTVNNVFNRDPPLAPAPYFVFGTSGGATNGSLFDLIRSYTLGIKLNL